MLFELTHTDQFIWITFSLHAVRSEKWEASSVTTLVLLPNEELCEEPFCLEYKDKECKDVARTRSVSLMFLCPQSKIRNKKMCHSTCFPNVWAQNKGITWVLLGVLFIFGPRSKILWPSRGQPICPPLWPPRGHPPPTPLPPPPRHNFSPFRLTIFDNSSTWD